MRVHVRVSEGLVRDIICNKFTVCRVERSWVHHRVLVVLSVSLRGAVIRWAHSAALYCLTKSNVRSYTSRAYLFCSPRTLRAFYEAYAKLGTGRHPKTRLWTPIRRRPSHCEGAPLSAPSRTSYSFCNNGISSKLSSFVQWNSTHE